MAQDDIKIEIEDVLSRLDYRLSGLEKDALFIEKNIGIIDAKKNASYTELHKCLDGIKEEMQSLKAVLRQQGNNMMMLASDLKGSVKKQDVETISKDADAIEFADYITVNEFKRGL